MCLERLSRVSIGCPIVELVVVKGKLERQGEVIHVVVHTIARLTLPGGEDPPVRSRDFH